MNKLRDKKTDNVNMLNQVQHGIIFDKTEHIFHDLFLPPRSPFQVFSYANQKCEDFAVRMYLEKLP